MTGVRGMDMRVTHEGAVPFRSPEVSFARLDATAAARVLAAAGDIAIVVDSDGLVKDVAAASADLFPSGFANWVDHPLASTVTPESRLKIEEMIKDATAEKPPRWREVNHLDAAGESVPMRYLALRAGDDGRVIAIGRDLRAAAVMQQRLLQAQQSMERDYARLRQTEQRYRLLFQLASEAVLVVDASASRVLEVNPAAQRLLQTDEESIVGQTFTDLFDPTCRNAAAQLLSSPQMTGRPGPMSLETVSGVEVVASASLFRQERASHLMVRLTPRLAAPVESDEAERRLLEALERMPDAFVVTDADMRILAVNAAFLELSQLPGPMQAENQPLERFLGRPGVDLKVLIAGLREHMVVRSFSTVIRSQFDTTDEVEVSAVSLLDSPTPCMAFSIRSIGRRLRDQPAGGRELPRSVSQLTSLVGRVSLKEIVRETTDRIERLCIEAALELTADNRASAAELLGLSRQSFYSKLHRHGLGNLSSEEE